MITSVIIPAYNESERIVDTINGINDLAEVDEIVVVDDGSSDNTAQVVKSIDIEKLKFYIQTKNYGKGKALEKGLEIMRKDADIVVFLDADVGKTSSEVIKIIRPVLDDECDVAIARFRPASKKGGMGFVKRLAKDSVYEMTGVELNSTISGQRAFKREVIDRFDFMPDGYGVEVGMTVDILKWGYRVNEYLVDMTHNETGRDLKGFIHRGKQYLHIKKIVKQKKKEWGD
ncbi:glycosyltransferase family 2 protein [Peptostreptococcus anaerobius]|uniref:Glucosyl-3-phosphoglycerate synthase n=1 Tax=Peptostreptococcus porci TaxID=2652282 RepID=A0A6N7WYG5_9FIRM|nr:glycosyltransferase family 2 protein [Peptostreptococcus porci]MDD7182891.1 glycosyltransferase family 2 protein [Peptostreptococcus porci]MDY5964038.1 glycosyltransferase family 2 protein [Peptostreptococcus porci]MDY6232662.1 glycosyltransferase family 2 protein [Peptostreptococcus porci]MST61730.1 glycosyltransferase family 2 protein [Peptostreptococcus porci]